MLGTNSQIKYVRKGILQAFKNVRYPRTHFKSLGHIFFYMACSYLVLINRAGGLYGRILTEVASTDRTQ